MTYDLSSCNTGWVKTLQYFNKHDYFNLHSDVMFPLLLLDDSLAGVNPWDETLSDEIKSKIIAECRNNPIYFIREIAKDRKGNYIKLNRAVISALRYIEKKTNICFNIPFYDQYNLLMQSCMMAISIMNSHSSLDSESCISVSNYNWDIGLVQIPNFLNFIYNNIKIETDIGKKYHNQCVVFLNEYNRNSYEYRIVEEIQSYQSAYQNMMEFPIIILTSFVKYEMVNKTDYGKWISLSNDVILLSDNWCPRTDYIYQMSYDMIDMELNIKEVFKIIEKVYGKDNSIYDKIKLFTKYALNKNYDKLDILDKIHINKIYSELNAIVYKITI